MSLVETRYEHIVLNEDNVPVLAGTTMKVVELVAEHVAYGWNPIEMQAEHPYLTLGQIYSALAYYWDHQGDLDRDLARREKVADQMLRESGLSPVRIRLKSQDII